mgnify:CR=1 FL=1
MLCNICPRRCGAERTETRGGGVCAMPAGIVAAKAMLHQWEEPVLSGMNGVEDSLGGMETWYYIEVLRAGANSAAPIQTPAQARAALQAVTKEDVRSILRQLTLSVSYLLTKEEPTHA